MFTHTDMFTGYAAASPAVGWDNEVLSKYKKTFAAKKIVNPVKVYLTVGDVERERPVFEKFANDLVKHSFLNVSITSKVLENTGHSGTKSETYSRGLQYIFEKAKLKLSDNILNKYVGLYKLTNGNTVELKKENGQLVFYFSPTYKYNLFAASETEFYSTTNFFKMYFKNEDDKITGFELQQYGNTQFVKK